jgi:hypothetical protein
MKTNQKKKWQLWQRGSLSNDDYHYLDRKDQVTIFRLKTGYILLSTAPPTLKTWHWTNSAVSLRPGSNDKAGETLAT